MRHQYIKLLLVNIVVFVLCIIAINVYKGPVVIEKMPPYTNEGAGAQVTVTDLTESLVNEGEAASVSKAFNNYLIRFIPYPDSYKVDKKTIIYSTNENTGNSNTSLTILDSKNNPIKLTITGEEALWYAVTIVDSNNNTYSYYDNQRPTPAYGESIE